MTACLMAHMQILITAPAGASATPSTPGLAPALPAAPLRGLLENQSPGRGAGSSPALLTLCFSSPQTLLTMNSFILALQVLLLNKSREKKKKAIYEGTVNKVRLAYHSWSGVVGNCTLWNGEGSLFQDSCSVLELGSLLQGRDRDPDMLRHPRLWPQSWKVDVVTLPSWPAAAPGAQCPLLCIPAVSAHQEPALSCSQELLSLGVQQERGCWGHQNTLVTAECCSERKKKERMTAQMKCLHFY